MMADLATRSGNFPLALKHLDAALAIEPDHILAQMKRAELLHKLNRYSEAIQYLDAIPKRHEHRAALLARRGTILLDLQRFEEARETFEALIKIEPKQYAAWNNLGNVYRSLGNLREAARCYAKAASLTKTDPTPRSNHLTALHYNPEVSAEEIYKVCQALGAMLASKRKPVRPAPIDRSPDKILRVGMFSDGFRQHPVGSMTVSALELLGSMGVEIYAYSTSNIVDGLTRRIMGAVKKWTPISHISHLESEKFAEIIRNDGIDILIDLAGHNAGSRMHTIALEPAPILVKWVGGLINTTGVEAFDYLITDSVESPPGSDHLYTEKLIRMPDDYICFAPPAHVPAVGPLPALKNGHITFGCFNNPTKINDVVLEQWAQLLHALPASRLFLKGAAYESTAFRNRIFDTLSKHGIGQDRIRMEGHSPHQELLARYNKVDIALDPWPYSGGLTTCEAMLMGVPVVTLPGPTFAGRHSATHLVNAGMPELVVQDWAQYRDRVLELASDLESLATIRSHLRRVLLESPVCNSERFARNLANALRAIWQRYCEGKPPAALTLDKDGTAWFEGEAEPVSLQHPDLSEHQADEFNFAFKGRVVVVDHGGALVANPTYAALNRLGALTTIALDPAGKLQDIGQLKLSGDVQHHTHIALGDQNGQATLYACLDNNFSSTLESLPSAEQLPTLRQPTTVLANVPIPTVRLDSIAGLERIDWLALDDAHDNAKILEGAGRLLDDLLVAQVRARFVEVSKGQLDLGRLSTVLAKHGLRLLRLINPKFISHGDAEIPDIDGGSQLLYVDAVFVPTEARLQKLDDNQRLKLAFILHSAYRAKDLAYKVLSKLEGDAAKRYLAANQQPAPQGSKPPSGDDAGPRLISQEGVKPVAARAPAQIVVPDQPHMEQEGIRLLDEHLRKARVFLEYGAGGSSVMAARSAVEKIYSVESDPAFLRAVQEKIAGIGIQPNRYVPLHVDIGPTGAWGHPSSKEFSHRWPHYPQAPWDRLKQDQKKPDLILIDGRFRVATLLASLLHAPAGCTILFDDYADRAWYHAVETFLKPRRLAGRMAEFVVPETKPAGLGEAIQQHYQDPR